MRVFIILILNLCLFANAKMYNPLVTVPYNKKLAEIGKRLYFDINLSPNKISCNTCHDLNLTGSGTSISGINSDGKTNPPTVLNIVYSNLFFKDGSVTNLKNQVKKTLTLDMSVTKEQFDKFVKRNKLYKKWFKEIGLSANYENMIDALVEFEKSLVTLNSPFDLYLKGNNKAISNSAKNGFKLFNKYGCSTCHNGSSFGGNIVARINDSFSKYCSLSNDRVKVPTLRNIEITAPYTYDGSYYELEDMIKVMGVCQLGVILPDDEVDDIVEFLKTLTGNRPKILEN